MSRFLLLVLYSLGLSGVCLGQNWRPFVPGANHSYLWYNTWMLSTLEMIFPIAQGATVSGDSVLSFPDALTSCDSCIRDNYFNDEDAVAGKMRPMSFWGNRILYHTGRIRFLIPNYKEDLVDTLDIIPNALASYRCSRFRVSAITKTYDTVWAGVYDTVFKARIAGGYLPTSCVMRYSKNYGLVEMPALFQDSAELTHPVLLWPKPGTILRLKASPRHDYHRIPSTLQFFPYLPGDTLGQLVTNQRNGDRYYSRYVIRSRTIDSVRQHVKFVFTVHLSNRVVWGSPALFYTSQDSLTLPLRIPFHHNGITHRSVEYNYSDSRFPSLYEDIGYGSYTESGAFARPDTGLRKGCIYHVPDGHHRFDYGAGRGMMYGTSEFTNEHGQDCYSIGGRGLPCGKLLLVGLKEGQSAHFILKDNPVSSQLEVLSPTPLHLILQDLQGRTVAEGWETRALDVRLLPPGLYQLRAQDKQGRSQVLRVAKD